MIAGMRVQAGSLLQIRTHLSRTDLQRRPADAWPGAVIRLGPDLMHLENAAFIEAGQADGMKKSGWRHLTLWAEAAKRNLIAAVDTEHADGERAAYRIVDPAGAVLARVVRTQGSVTGFRRTHWTVEITGGPTLRAVKGSVFGWCVWWALSPLWAVLALAAIFGGDVARMPLKAVFRGDHGEMLRYSSVTGTDHDFRVDADWPDPRVLFALTALHNSHLSWRDRP
jgi:hypothetical protein